MGRAGGWAVHRLGHRCHRNHLADPLTRYLLISQRRIPAEKAAQYAQLWHSLRRSVEAAGGRAWLFGSHDSSDLYTEFVEWESTGESLSASDSSVARASNLLAIAFPPEESGTWIEAKV